MWSEWWNVGPNNKSVQELEKELMTDGIGVFLSGYRETVNGMMRYPQAIGATIFAWWLVAVGWEFAKIELQ